MANGVTIQTGGTTPAGSEAPPPNTEVTQNQDGSVSVVGKDGQPAPQPPAGTQQQTPNPAPTGEQPKPQDTPGVPKITKPEKPAAIDLSEAVTEFGKNGKLSDATYAKAEKMGLSRDMVDTYIAGHQSRVTQVASKLSEIAGGHDGLKAVIEWAGANVDDATRDAFNAAVDRGDTTAASLMLRGLMAARAESLGTEGEVIVGRPAPGGVQPFTSWDQVRLEMRKPEYSNDPAFRELVKRRLNASKL